MSDSEQEYYYRISYEEYVRLMKKWIEKSRLEMLFYLNMLSQCKDIVKVPDEESKKVIDEYVCNRYSRKFFESLDNYLNNLDTFYLVNALKEDFAYFINQYGVPVAFYIPEELQRKLKRMYNNPYIL